TLFHACGQTHSFLILAALKSKTSSASRVNGLQAYFALRDFLARMLRICPESFSKSAHAS
ncbi:hypothetical protein, partial [Bacillus cereus group sp. MG33]|uniref:hypothetical protein n=1 Tax=Bacillus cereus group sp. MG33 TaxID=3040252 RepID=UPI003394D533